MEETRSNKFTEQGLRTSVTTALLSEQADRRYPSTAGSVVDNLTTIATNATSDLDLEKEVVSRSKTLPRTTVKRANNCGSKGNRLPTKAEQKIWKEESMCPKFERRQSKENLRCDANDGKARVVIKKGKSKQKCQLA